MDNQTIFFSYAVGFKTHVKGCNCHIDWLILTIAYNIDEFTKSVSAHVEYMGAMMALRRFISRNQNFS